MCPICKSQNNQIVYSDLDQVYKVHLYGIRKKLDIKKCLNCGIVFTAPQLDFVDLKEYFSGEYRAFAINPASKGILGCFKKFAYDKTLEQFFGYGRKKWYNFFFYPFKIPLAHYPYKIENGRVLDIGCGSGNFLAKLKALGWDVYGIDPSSIAVKIAKGRDLKNIQQGVIGAVKFPDNFFDVVTMFHVFEHIPNPRKVLSEIKRILKPGGFLIIGVPNFNGVNSKIFRKYWAGLSFPLHCFHYGKQSLSFLFNKNTFKIRNIYYAIFFSDLFVSSPENMVNLKFNYKIPLSAQKIFKLADIFLGIFDYLIGHLFINFFRAGSQITIIGQNIK